MLRWVFILLAIAVLAVAGERALEVRDQLVAQRQGIEAAWSKLEDDLEQRVETLPKLLDAVARSPQVSRPSVTAPSRELARSLELVEKAEDRAGIIEANRKIEGSLAELLTAVTQYPHLSRDKELQQLLDETAAVDNHLHHDRTEYNEAVQRFNIRLALFPSNLVANLFGIQRHEFYVPTDLGIPANARASQVAN